MALRYLKNIDIDKKKWDECINNSLNGLIYGYSWYLDCMAVNWDALVEDDYISVFPLPWKRKYGIKYIYQPFFTQQLGVFSTGKINKETLHNYIKAIPIKFLKTHINLNYMNRLKLKDKERKNLLLDLSPPYDIAYKNYKSDVRTILRNAQKNDLYIKDDLSPSLLIANYEAEYNSRHKNIRKEDYKRLQLLCEKLRESNDLYLSCLYNGNGVLCGGIIILKCSKRHQWILNYQSTEGKLVDSQYILMDNFIKKECNQHKVLDFGGSEIQSIAFFLTKFGASPEYYYPLHINRLKFWEKTIL